MSNTLHTMTVDESLVISQRVVELVKKECKQMGILYSNRPLLIAAYAAGNGPLNQCDLLSNDLAFDMKKDSVKDAAPQEPLETEEPLGEEPVTKTERQSFAKMIAQQQELIDKLFHNEKVHEKAILRLCNQMLEFNKIVHAKVSEEELLIALKFIR